MRQVLDHGADASVLVFIVTSMLTMGLRLTLAEIRGPLADWRAMCVALFANFGLAPAFAWGVQRVIPLHPSHATGLLLLGAAAGAPFLPKLAEFARGDLGYSVALMILLTVGSIIFLPFALPLLISGLKADPWPLARPLVFFMMTPLVAGLVLKKLYGGISGALHAISRWLSQASLIVLLALLVGLNGRAILGTLGSGAIAAALLFVFLCLMSGYLLGGKDKNRKIVLGLGTGQRNVAAALAIAAGNFDDPKVVTMLLVATLFGLVPLLMAGKRARRGREISA